MHQRAILSVLVLLLALCLRSSAGVAQPDHGKPARTDAVKAGGDGTADADTEGIRFVVGLGHERMTSLVASPDGKLWLSAGDHHLFVWDATQARPVRDLLSPNGKDIRLARFEPGQHAIVGLDENGNVIRWDLDSGAARVGGQPWWPFFIPPPAMSDDGAWIAGGSSSSCEVTLADSRTAKRATIWSCQGRAPLALAFDAANTTLAFGDSAGGVHLYDLRERKMIEAGSTRDVSRCSSRAHGAVTAVAFSADGQRLGVGYADGVAAVCDLQGHTPAVELAPVGEARGINALAFDPGGTRLAGLADRPLSWNPVFDSGGPEPEWFVWQLADRSTLAHFSGRFSVVGLFRDASSLAVGDATGTVAVHDLNRKGAALALTRGFRSRPCYANALTFFDRGRRFIAAGSDGIGALDSAVWDLEHGDASRPLDLNGFSNTGQFFVRDDHLLQMSLERGLLSVRAAGADWQHPLPGTGQVRLDNDSSEEAQGLWQLGGGSRALVWQGERLAWFNATTGHKVATLEVQGRFYGTAAASSGQVVLLTSAESMFDPSVHLSVYRLDQSKPSAVFDLPRFGGALALSRSGKVLAVSTDQSLELRRSEDGTVRQTIPLTSPLTGGPEFSSDDATVYLATADRHLSAFDVRTGRRLWEAPTVEPLTRLSFSPEKKILAAALPDHTTVVLHSATDGRHLCSLTSFFGQAATTTGPSEHAAWVVWTPQGFFDASPEGAAFVTGVRGLAPLSPEELQARAFPGLLAAVLTGKPVRAGTNAASVAIVSPTDGTGTSAELVSVVIHVDPGAAAVAKIRLDLNSRPWLDETLAHPSSEPFDRRFRVPVAAGTTSVVARVQNTYGATSSSIPVRIEAHPSPLSAALELQNGHGSSQYAGAFAPHARLGAFSLVDGSAALWDTVSGLKLRTLPQCPVPARRLSFTPDESRLVGAGERGQGDDQIDGLCVWEVATGTLAAVHLGTYDGPEAALVREDRDDPLRNANSLGTFGALGKSAVAEALDLTWTPDGGSIFVRGDNRVFEWTLDDLQVHVRFALPPDHSSLADGLAGFAVAPGLLLTSRRGSLKLESSAAAGIPDPGGIPTPGVEGLVSPIRLLTAPDGRGFAGLLYSLQGDSDEFFRLGKDGSFVRASLTTQSSMARTLDTTADGTLIAGGYVVGPRSDGSTPSHSIRMSPGFGSPTIGQTVPAMGLAPFDKSPREGALWILPPGGEPQQWLPAMAPISAVAVTRDGKRLFVGCEDGTELLWNPRTRLREHALAHRDGMITAAAFSADGQWLASGAADGTLVLVPVRDPKHSRYLWTHTGGVESVAFSPDGRHLATSGRDRVIRLWDVASGTELALLATTPTAAGFIALPDGHYLASKQALKAVTFRIGNRVVPFDQFDTSWNRPDLVLASMRTALGTVRADLVATAQAAQARRALGLAPASASSLAQPQLRIVDSKVSDNTLQLHLDATDPSGKGIARVRVWANDVPLSDVPVTGGGAVEVAVPLAFGANRIRVAAVSVDNRESLAEVAEANRAGEQPKRTLYLLALGVSRYDALSGVDHAVDDAKALVQRFKGQAAPFEKVVPKLLRDEDVTLDGVRQAAAMFQQASVDDLVVVFAAGHGLGEAGRYWFAPTEADPQHPETSAIPYEAMEDLVARTPARQRLLLLDTCNAGALDAAEGASGAGGFEAMRYFFADLSQGSGAVVIAATRGDEKAREINGHGLFTGAVIEGLFDGKADLDADGVITVLELGRYVSDQVRALHVGTQAPEFRRDVIDRDFAVALAPGIVASAHLPIGSTLVRVTPDGRAFVTRQNTGAPIGPAQRARSLWDAKTLSPLETISPEHEPEHAVGFSPDLRFQLSSNATLDSTRPFDPHLDVYDRTARRNVCTAPLYTVLELDQFHPWSFGPQQVLLERQARFGETETQPIVLVDWSAGCTVRPLRLTGGTSPGDPVYVLGLSAERHRAVAVRDATVDLYDLQRDQVARSLRTPEGWTISDAALGGPLARIAMDIRKGEADELQVFDLESGTRLVKAPLAAPALALAFSHDARLLAIAFYAGTVDIWDVSAGRKVATLSAQPEAFSAGVLFGPDDQTIATLGGDGMMRLWRTPAAGPTATGARP